MLRHDLGEGAWVTLDEGFLGADEADALLETLLASEPWEQRDIVVFGRPIAQPRLIAWAGALPYRYSGQTLEPRPTSAALQGVVDRIERAVDGGFNHVLLNRYRDGRDHMSRHADNEPELGRDPLIAALSLGATRAFTLEHKRHRKRKHRLLLTHGSLLVMGGTCQHTWRHAVPRHPHLDAERINLTLRRLHGPPGWRAPRPAPPADPREARA